MKIIIRIQGGTGNQLFQYAFGRGVSTHLSKKLGRPVEFLIDKSVCDDSRWDPHKIHRKYSLGLFRTDVKFAKDSDLCGFIWIRKRYKFFDRAYRFIKFKRFLLPFYRPEQSFTFDEGVYDRKDTTYFDGDWTTGKYFENIADEIRREITAVEPISESYRNTLADIRNANAISLHVRRGDYTTDPMAINFHGVCSSEYYRDAIAYMEKHVTNPHFFIFSDDYEWSRENFKFIRHPVTCIQGSEGKDYEDLTLMRECKHHIIANSTFGWWGAWLNPKKDKIMIAPKKWFANAPKGDAKDLLTDEWIKM